MRLLAALILALAACSCRGLNSPTEPDADVRLTTAYGTVSVWSDGSAYDLDAIRSSLERGQRRALAQRDDAPSLSGLTVAIYRRQVWTGVDSVGAYDIDEDTILALAGIEEVVDHELQHRASWRVGNRGECYRLADHSPGFDLACHAR